MPCQFPSQVLSAIFLYSNVTKQTYYPSSRKRKFDFSMDGVPRCSHLYVLRLDFQFWYRILKVPLDTSESFLCLFLHPYWFDSAMSLTEEVQKLRQQNRELAKENARLKEENEFLAEASAFFAASRRKSPKT